MTAQLIQKKKKASLEIQSTPNIFNKIPTF